MSVSWLQVVQVSSAGSGSDFRRILKRAPDDRHYPYPGYPEAAGGEQNRDRHLPPPGPLSEILYLEES
jgi:hypothetical protein